MRSDWVTMCLHFKTCVARSIASSLLVVESCFLSSCFDLATTFSLEEQPPPYNRGGVPIKMSIFLAELLARNPQLLVKKKGISASAFLCCYWYDFSWENFSGAKKVQIIR